jgi:hypothetical protein
MSEIPLEDHLLMNVEDVGRLTPKRFGMLVRRVTFPALGELLPLGRFMDGRDMRTVCLWFMSFILGWSSHSPPDARANVAALLRKAADVVELGEEDRN